MPISDSLENSSTCDHSWDALYHSDLFLKYIFRKIVNKANFSLKSEVTIATLYPQNQAAKNFFIKSKTITKFLRNGIAIYIKKTELSGFKALEMVSKVRWHPKFNLGQLNE